MRISKAERIRQLEQENMRLRSNYGDLMIMCFERQKDIDKELSNIFNVVTEHTAKLHDIKAMVTPTVEPYYPWTPRVKELPVPEEDVLVCTKWEDTPITIAHLETEDTPVLNSRGICVGTKTILRWIDVIGESKMALDEVKAWMSLPEEYKGVY